jgi:thioredoxin 1
MFSKKTTAAFAAVAMAFAVGAGATLAGEPMAYDMTSFDKAQGESRHIVVEVFKNGCPTCKLQQPGLNEARAKFPNADFVKVDFLGDAAPVKRFNASKQSTIIVFKGKEEVARLVGETDKDAIVAAIGKGA